MKTMLTSLAVLILTGPALAQGPTGPAGSRCPGRVVYAVGPWHPWAGRHWHAATAAESYLRGQADVIRARGYYNLLSSQAAINATEAYRAHLDNQLKRTETYFAMRKVNQEETSARRASRRSRYLEAAANRPKPRPTEILDAVAGNILWPTALLGEPYAADRTFVERVQAHAKSGGPITQDARAQLAQTVDRMVATLRTQVRQTPGTDYAAAKRFLQNLTCESLLDAGAAVAVAGL